MRCNWNWWLVTSLLVAIGQSLSIAGRRSAVRTLALFSELESTRGSDSSLSRAREAAPARNDLCKVLASGIIGVEPKEYYRFDGHYSLSFPIAIVGHFSPIHSGERHRPLETQWLQCELWNDLARRHAHAMKKGAKVCFAGQLVQAKWVDRHTGEDKRALRLRVSAILDEARQQRLEEAFREVDTQQIV